MHKNIFLKMRTFEKLRYGYLVIREYKRSYLINIGNNNNKDGRKRK